MPSSREIVVNTALSGDELRQILLADFPRLLAAEGMLRSNAAFGRVSYTIALRLELDNPFFPESTTRITSLPVDPKQAEADPTLKALERPPLASPSPDAGSGGTVARRKIDSPNAERLRMGLPVPVLVDQQDGTRSQQYVQYPAPPGSGDTGLSIVDESKARDLGWNIIDASKDQR